MASLKKLFGCDPVRARASELGLVAGTGDLLLRNELIQNYPRHGCIARSMDGGNFT